MKSTLFLVGDGAMFRRNISAPSSGSNKPKKYQRESRELADFIAAPVESQLFNPEDLIRNSLNLYTSNPI